MLPMKDSSETSTEKVQRKKRLGWLLFLGVVVLAVVLLCSFLIPSSNSPTDLQGSAPPTPVPGSIQTSSLKFSSNGRAQSIEYFHCSSQVSPEETQSIVLLHGSSFSKKNWKRSGNLERLCEYPNLSVSAMDLPVSARHGELKGMLSAMKDVLHIKLPVVLVTPSASGYCIVDWARSGTIEELPDYVGEWIPIASGSVNSLSDDQLTSMAKLDDFKVFAMNGDGDKGGRTVTATLETSVGAEALELPGGHAFYLDADGSAVEFCNAVANDLGVSKEPSSQPTLAVSNDPSSQPTLAASNDPSSQPAAPSSQPSASAAPTYVPGSIYSGNLAYSSTNGGARSIEYYHCSSEVSPEETQSVVLLHGSSFSKKNWQRSGNLERLCDYPSLSVSAMDLPVSAGHDDLKGMLSAMKDDLHISLPVVLVTPSASGYCVVNWVQKGNVDDLPDYVGEWIPIASGSVNYLSDDQLASMAKLDDFKVFAMNGDRDKGGRKEGAILENSVGAKTLELPGGHAFYIDNANGSPVEFCDAVASDLGVGQNRN
eukprot:scaffold825_cov147-Cylindrotheca_fusiformis.AAC.7